MSLKNLKEITNEDVDRFSLDGEEGEVKVVSILDGNTCDLAFYRKEELVRFKCHLEMICAPEIHQKNGKLVHNYLAHLCLGGDLVKFDADPTLWNKKDLQNELNKNKNLVYAVFGKFDKYGRALATLYRTSSIKDKSINDMVRDYVDELIQNVLESSEADLMEQMKD